MARKVVFDIKHDGCRNLLHTSVSRVELKWQDRDSKDHSS